MVIVLNCPGCKRRYELDGALAGKKSRCRQCGEVFRIPVPMGRAVAPAAPPPPPAAAAQPAWTAAPLDELLDGDPMPQPPPRRPVPAPRPTLREPATGIDIPARPARGRPAPAPSAFDDGLPPPPRAGYRPERRRRAADDRPADTDLGVTVFGWFMLIDAVLMIGLVLYLSVASIDPRRAALLFNLGIAISLTGAYAMALWGIIWMLCLAFRDSVMSGVLSLFLPGYMYYFALRGWPERKGALMLLMTPWLAVALNLGLSWLTADAVRANVSPGGFGPAAQGRPFVQEDGPPPDSDAVPGPPTPRGARRFGPRLPAGGPPPMDPPGNVAATPAPALPTAGPDPDIPEGADAITRSMIELESADRGRRKQALERLQRSAADGRVDQVVGAIVPLLEDDDGFLVVEAVKALAVWRSPEGMAGLIGRLGDNRFFVRQEAIKALGPYRDPRAAEAIVPRMKEDGFQVEEAFKAMGPAGEPAMIAVLRDTDPDLRRNACRILAQIGGQETLRAMQGMPPDPDFSVRVAAQDAARQIVARVGPLPRAARGKATSGPRP